MSFDKEKGFCHCERCGYDWRVRHSFDGNHYSWTEPKSCAKCKSKVWNQPRVYAGKYISGTLARRYKPTGRAAKKETPENLWSQANDSEKKTIIMLSIGQVLERLDIK